MNGFFELLHEGHTAFAVFAIDVAVFVVLAVVIYALVFLAKNKISKFLKNTGLSKSASRYFKKGKSKKI
jgi:threonine/homoserine/homoserine lactone efflux protein